MAAHWYKTDETPPIPPKVAEELKWYEEKLGIDRYRVFYTSVILLRSLGEDVL